MPSTHPTPIRRTVRSPRRVFLLNWTAVLGILMLTAIGCHSASQAWAETRHADGSGLAEPVGLMLSWQRDPTTTITIDWHVLKPREGERAASSRPVVDVRPLGEHIWRRITGGSKPFPHSNRIIHRVEVASLQPDTVYEFRLHEMPRIYRFQTLPATLGDGESLRFAVGGDVRHRQDWMEETNRMAVSHQPRFIVWGGDLAYADGEPKNVGRWYEFFDAMKNTFIDEDGLVTPLIVAIGNHEIRGHSYLLIDDYAPTDAWRAEYAPFFYELFAFPGQPGYNVLDFGDYLSMVILDSAHANPVEGDQTTWLARTLAARKGRMRHIMPVMHVPAYPSVRRFDGEMPLSGGISRDIRTHWCPLFDAAGVRLVFEHHDHAYKRSVPIRAGAAREDGIVYIGDGAWGVGARRVHDAAATWYLEKSATNRHALIVTLRGESITVRAITPEGVELDRWESPSAEHHDAAADRQAEMPVGH